MRPIRVCYVQRPTGGGSMTGLLDMVRLLDRSCVEPVVLFYHPNDHVDRFRTLGAEVAVLRETPSPSPMAEGAKEAIRPLKEIRGIREVNRLLRRDWRVAGAIREKLREIGPDLVHHNDNPHGDRASILAAWREDLPQVCHVRFTDTLYPPLERLVARTADRLVFVSEWVGETVAAALGRVAERGSVVYDPVDYGQFAPDPEAREEVARELGFSGGAPLVVNVGRLVPWKGQDVFLRAAGRVLAEHPESVFLLVGAGPSGDGGAGYEQELRRLVARSGIGESMRFTGRRDDVPRLMAAADVVVHSSTRPEPFGRVLVEALACGTPVVASASGGPREIVDDGLTGFLTLPGDPAGMAEAVAGLLARPGRAREMGGRGRRTVRTRFSPDAFRRRIESVYTDVLDRNT